VKTALFALIGAVVGISVATAGVTKGIYHGTSKTRVTYLNPTTLQPVSTQAFTCNETVTIAAPQKARGVTELNPFSLTVLASVPKTPPVVGDVKTASARLFPSVFGGLVLLQYWTLQNTATGFVGELDDNHLADGFARDRVMANLSGPHGAPIAYKMEDAEIGSGLQCTLVATVTGRVMVLKITGYAIVPNQALIQFTTKINARR
jgi:hypothetical protein